MELDDANVPVWYLEGVLTDGKHWMIAVEPLPFTVGRNAEHHLCLSSKSVSRNHAELFVHEGSLWVRDVGSKNGTFVNRRPIFASGTSLADGDVIHFGSAEFRIGLKERDSAEETTTNNFLISSLSTHFQASEGLLRSLLEARAVVPLFQPIVRLPDGRRHGYELLGRGAYPGLPTHPAELFAIADAAGLDAQLSQLFWEEGLACGIGLPGNPALFINIHHTELERPELVAGLRRFREANPQTRITVEISEKAVTDLTRMARLRQELSALNMHLAYDDFGAGQPRFLELVEVPPHVLKFDIALVRGIHQRPKRLHQVVQTLVQMATDLGIAALAEGVECREEREVCAQLGFQYAQGYFFGRPGRPPDS